MVGLINRVVKQRRLFGVNHSRSEARRTLLSQLAGVVQGKMRKMGDLFEGKIRGMGGLHFCQVNRSGQEEFTFSALTA
jgi:hypothetical protein